MPTTEPLLGTLLPPPVACAESFTDPPDAVLYPGEAEAVARAVPKRRREFTTARHCARRALAALGFPPAPLIPGRRGAPIWPEGVVGSMTHCDGYRAAAVARASDLASVGIDAEPSAPLPEGVLDVTTAPAERSRLTELAALHPQHPWDRLLFSAKESVFKAWYPLTHRELDFLQADLTLHPTGTFTAHLLAPHPPLPTFTGHWLHTNGLILTAVAVPPTGT